EGADAGVGLVVVVAEGAFIVAFQLGDTVIDAKCPVVRESLADFEFHRFVFTLRVFVGVRFAVGVELTTESRAGTRLALREARATREHGTGRICPGSGVYGW